MPIIEIWHKKSSKIPLDSFCMDHPLLSRGSALKCGLYTHWGSSGENYIFLGNQLSIGNGFMARDGNFIPLLSPSAQNQSCLELCRSCACGHNPCEFVRIASCVSSIVSERQFPWCHLPSLDLAIFWPPPLHMPVSPETRDWVKTSHLELGVPKSPTLCILSNCGYQYSFPSTTARRVSDDGWTRHWSMDIAEFPEGSFYCCFFSRTILFGLLLDTYIVSDSWPPNSGLHLMQ